MNTIRYTLAIAGKELQVLFKDRGALVTTFLMPLLFAILMGSAFGAVISSDEEDAPAISLDVFLVDEDSGQYATRIVGILEEMDILNIETLDSAAEADKRVADGDALAAIIIPAGFSAQVDAYEPTQVQVILDPVREEGADIVSGIMNRVVAEVNLWGEVSYGISTVFEESGALEGVSAEMGQAAQAQSLGAILTQVYAMRESPIITVRSEDLAGVEQIGPDNAFVIFMPNFAVMFAFFLVGTIAITILREKEEGPFRRLIAAPMPRGAIIAGKMLTYTLVVLLQVALLFGVGNVAFDMPLGESPLGLLILSLALALTASALGMLLAALSKTSSQAETLGMVGGFVLGGLGGTVIRFPPDSFMSQLSLLTPQGHALRGFDSLLINGGGVMDILPQAGILVGFTVVFFVVAMRRFKFE